jgi:hypothetical protein
MKNVITVVAVLITSGLSFRNIQHRGAVVMGMPFRATPLSLSEDEQQELQRMSLSRSLPAGDVLRARLILMLAESRSLHRDSEKIEHYGSQHLEMKKTFSGTAH